jgi:predicted aldo/keto reductase-like oxidoreductase
MRFPRTLGKTDMAKTEALIVKAVENGVNYFDTAYVYGDSEVVLGRILEKNSLRDKVYVATKLPLGICHTRQKLDELFEEQCGRLQTKHIDYYFMHNLSDMATWRRLCGLGVEHWIEEKKREKRIRQVGFSFHGTATDFVALLDAYPWDFCQIQYNYVYTDFQAGKAGLRAAAARGLPVFIMEPLLGGQLANRMPDGALARFKESGLCYSPAAWALRWLWNQEEVTVVLSGMNEESQLLENTATAHQAVPNMLSAAEEHTLGEAALAFQSFYKIPCTGCDYCMPCPHGVNIPACFASYNVACAAGFFAGFQQYVVSTGASNSQRKNIASRCVACGACEKKCPQHILIVEKLRAVKKRLEPFWFKTGMAILEKLL